MKASLQAGVTTREVWSWAAFDFANSGYTTVVMTAVFNAYFVGVVAGNAEWATFLWTVVVAASNALGVLVMPFVGGLADRHANKKTWLFAATALAVLGTFGLAFSGPGTIVWSASMVLLSNLGYILGETLNSAFLPELSKPESVGRISGLGWSFGYLGGIATLGCALVIVQFGPKHGFGLDACVSATLAATAVVFMLASTPTFLWLKERAKPSETHAAEGATASLAATFRALLSLREFPDFGLLAVCGFLYQSGVSVVISLSAVYASAVMGFTTEDTILMVFVVNFTAAAGAYLFGKLQDRIGHKAALGLTLLLWLAMAGIAATTQSRALFWAAANLAGLAMGSSQSAGRAMAAVFAPPARTAEFFGYWNTALWLAAIVGPLAYGTVAWATGNNHRLAIGVTAGPLALLVNFFVVLRKTERQMVLEMVRKKLSRHHVE